MQITYKCNLSVNERLGFFVEIYFIYIKNGVDERGDTEQVPSPGAAAPSVRTLPAPRPPRAAGPTPGPGAPTRGRRPGPASIPRRGGPGSGAARGPEGTG